MKNKRLKRVLILAVLAFAVLVLHLRWDDIVQKPLVPVGDIFLLAKQGEEYAEYLSGNAVFTEYRSIFYDYFKEKELTPAKYTSLRPWKYKLVVSSGMKPGLIGTTSSAIFNRDEMCVLYVYEDCLEIDGMTYLFPEEDEQGTILDFFDKQWNTFTHLYWGVPTGRVYPGEPQEDDMPFHYFYPLE